MNYTLTIREMKEAGNTLIGTELPSEESGFMFKDAFIKGTRCVLVQPNHIGTKWTRKNMIFRSSIWTACGRPVSLSYKKFFNYGEHPELVQDPTSFKYASLMEKLDGSTLIVSSFNGQLITRTRGTFDATQMDNGHEIAWFKDMYPKAFDFFETCDPDYSYIYEWVSPENRIVIGYDTPEMYLTNIISHKDYSYATQENLDRFAQSTGTPRPKRYQFDTVEHMMASVEAFNGTEGICFYFGGDQQIKKVKSAWYLALHRFKEHCSYEEILDLFLTYGRPNYVEFEARLTTDFDFECMKMARPFASQISDANKEVTKIVDHMVAFVEPLKKLAVEKGFREGRKLAAQQIGQAYGATNRASFAFQLLDGRELEKDAIKKLFFQVMKK